MNFEEFNELLWGEGVTGIFKNKQDQQIDSYASFITM